MGNHISQLIFGGVSEPKSLQDPFISRLVQSMKDATLRLQEDKGRREFISGTVDTDSAERLELLKTAREMAAALEDPAIAVMEIAKWPAAHAAFRTALDLKIFEIIGDDVFMSAMDIASLTGIDPTLATRMMRTLVGIGVLQEETIDVYKHNKRSLTLKHPGFCTYVSGLSATTNIMPKLPDFLASLHYQNPDDKQNALFQYANNTNLNLFEWMQDHPEQLARFSATMSAATELQAPSLEATLLSLLSTIQYDEQDAENKVLLVDVGGGRGDVLSSVRKRCAGLQGRFVVQDLPKEIEDREPVEGIDAMAYDFFTPQPIKGILHKCISQRQFWSSELVTTKYGLTFLNSGASIYFFCHIFHDWPDSACRQILGHTIPALRLGRSKLVIVDLVVPEVGASAFTCMMDISMIAFGGMERTERQWRALLEGEGLTIVRIEGPKPGNLLGDSVIETELKSGGESF